MSGPNQRKIYKGFDEQPGIPGLRSIMLSIGDSKAWALWFYLFSSLQNEAEVPIDAQAISLELNFGEKALKSAWDKLASSGFLEKNGTNNFMLLTIKKSPIIEDKKWSVYELVFPNLKRYIGISSNPDARFNGGEGYRSQEVYEPILFFGWENIQHNIIKSELSKEEALNLERRLIKEFRTLTEGYNRI